MATINLTQLKQEKVASKQATSSFENAPTIVLNSDGTSSVEKYYAPSKPQVDSNKVANAVADARAKMLTNKLQTASAEQTKTNVLPNGMTFEENQNAMIDTLKNSAGYIGEKALKGAPGAVASLGYLGGTMIDNAGSTLDYIYDKVGEKNEYVRLINNLANLTDAATKGKVTQMKQNLDEAEVFNKTAGVIKDKSKEVMDWSKESSYNPEEISTGVQIAGDIVGGISQMVPSIAATALTKNPVVGKVMMSGSAAGSALDEALANGATYEDALTYAVATGTTEYVLESLGGSIPGLGEGKLATLAKEFVEKNLSGPIGKQIVGLAVDALGEGAEEYLSSVIGEYLTDIYTDEKTKDNVLTRFMNVQDEALYSALIGGLTGAVMNVPGTVRGFNADNSEVQTEKRTLTDDQVNEMTERLKTEAEQEAQAPKYADPIMNQIDAQEKAKAEQYVNEISNQPKQADYILEGLRSNDTLIKMQSQIMNEKEILKSAKQYGIDTKDAKRIAKVANKTNTRVLFKDLTYIDKNGKTVSPEGMYQNGVIYISPKTVNPLYQVFKHELTHYIEDSDLYKDFQKVIFSLYDEMTLNTMRENLRRERSDIVDEFGNDEVRLAEEIDKELAAILSQDKIFTDKFLIEQLAQTKPNFVETVYRWIKNRLSIARGEMTAEEVKIMETAEKLYRKALEDVKNKPVTERSAQQMAVKPVEDITKSQYDKAKDFIVPNSMYRRISDAVNTHAKGLKYKKLVLNLSDFDAIVLLKGDGYFKVISVKLGNNYVEPKRSKRKGISRNGGSGDSGGNRRIYRFRDDGTEIVGNDDGFSSEYQKENNRRDRTDNAIRDDKNRNRGKLSQSLNSKLLLKDSTKVGSFFDDSFKKKQLEIILENNPMTDDYHVGIRSVDDIKTFEEAMKDDESFFWGDFSLEDAQEALEQGEVTVYSSKPMKQGNFVSTSYNQARDYAGGGIVYSKVMKLSDIAWINGDEGQVARVTSDVYSNGKKLTKEQHEYFKDSQVRDINGNLQPVYPASPNAEFYVFDKTKASPESDMGAGFYFSNQEVDAESNYSDETGPDIKNKIDRLAEQLEYEDGFEDTDYDERYEEAKRRIVTGKTKHEVYLNIKNPVYVGNNQTELLTYDTLQEYADDNNDGEIYEGIEDDFLYNLTEDLYDILDDSGVQTVNGIVYDALLDGGIDLQSLKENLNNAYLEDSEGNFIGNEVARRLVESLGYDGIIDSTVSTKFKGMGLDPDTVHYIAFNPNQIKNVTNKKPSESDDIRFSRGLSASELLGNSKDPLVRAKYQMEKRIKGTFLFNSKSDPRKMYEITSRLEHEFNQTGKISAESRQELFNAAYNETLKNADITYKELPEFKQMIKEDLNRAVTQYENTLIKERELLKFAQENDIPVSEVKLNPTFGYLRNVKPEELPDKIISYKKLKASLKSDLVGQVDNYAGGKQIDELIDQAAKEILEDGYISSTTKFKIRQEMIENGYSINDENMRDNKELYDFIKSTKLNVPRGFGREIQDYERTRKLLKTSTSEGRPIDQVYNELRGKFGEFFPDALTNPADQYQQIYEVMAELEPVRIMMEDSEQYNAEMRQYLEDTFTDRLEDFKNQVVYRSQKDYYDRAAKKQVAEDSALNQISEAISEKFFKDNQEIDELKKSEHVISSAASIDELAEVVAKIRDKGALSKTLAQNLDAMAGGDVVLRAKLREIFEKPLREAKRSYVTSQKRVLDDVYKRITQDLGIKMDSKESAAMMWYGEGRRALNNVKGKVESDKLEFTPYTLDNLKQDFPETWKNIVEADKIMRKYYDDYVDRINASLERIYSEHNLKEQVAQRRTELQQEIREAMERLEQYKSQRQGEVGTPDVEARINAQRKRITDLSRQFNNVAEDVYRNKRLNKRSDYYHHFQDIGMVDSIMDVLKGDSANNISNALAGISENTKPKAKWEKFMQKRSEMARYEEDAIKGFLKYAPAAEYKIAFDPYVAQMRGTIQDIIKLSDEANINNAKAINWLTNYVNSLAGKTNPLDRWVANTESGRAILQILNKVNSRVKANAVAGNLNSAVSQFYNLPNGIAVLTDKGGAKASVDLTKGAADYAAYAAKKMAGKDVSDSPINQSVFLAERFIDSTLDRFDESILHKPQQAATFMLTFGDQVVAEQLWFSAYNQAQRLGKNDPIAYADDLVARAVAGRGIGEVPLAQQSQVVKLIAPFQVEVNNAWQLMKQMGVGALKDKDKALGLLMMYAVTWLMNEINQVITGNRVGMDIFNAMQDAAEGWNEEKNVVSNVFTAGGRLAGEALSNAPMGAQIAQMFVSDEYDRQKLFGESDPSRYGTGNIGINAIADPITQLVTGQNVDWQSVVSNFATPYGGKQLNRLYKLAEDTGILPRIDFNINEGLQVSKKQGAYNDKGQLKYQIDTSDPLNVAKGLAFGTYATNEGKDYIDEGYSALSDNQTKIYEAAVANGADLNYLYDAMRELPNIKSIKDEDGKTVSNSQAALSRLYLEEMGLYDNVVEGLEESGANPSGVNLSNTVIGMSDEQFRKFLKELEKYKK